MTSLRKETVTRRSILAGLAGGLLARHPGAFAAPAGSSDIDVLVIGAGLSGLYSAMLLEELGMSVQVIEGRNRIGGRLNTLYDLPGHPEVGGNTMASGYARMIDMAKRLDLDLVDYAPRMFGGSPPALVMGDSVMTRAQWAESPRNPFAEGFRDKMPWELVMSRLGPDNPLPAATDWLSPEFAELDTPLAEYFAQKGLGDGEIRLAYDTNPYYGTSAWDVSALMYHFNHRWTQQQAAMGRSAYATRGGNQRFAEAMAAQLNREVGLNLEVMSIDSDSGGVQVRCRNGKVFRSKRVICSLPFSKVRDLTITPSLEGLQRRAVRSLSYMRNTLVFLVPTQPFWDADETSPSMWTDGILGSVMAQRFDDDSDDVTGLVVNTRGWAADRLDRLGPQAAQARVIREIEKLRPAAKGTLEAGGFHSWWLDHFNAGDWAIFGPGQVSAMMPHMNTPHGGIHFCGEHTATGNRGMEGAMESAERVALEVVEKLG